MSRERSRHWLRNTILAGLLIVIVIGFLVGFIRQEQTLQALEKEQQEKRVEKEEMALQLEEMQRLIEYSSSDEYAEQQARRILGWIREDEILYVDPNEKTGNVSIPVVADGGTAEENFEGEQEEEFPVTEE